jgi:peptidyl-prolyl cis-trans isomerase NIMA-interacting 1
MSKTRGLPYYYNHETNESTWEPPPGTDLDALEAHASSIPSAPSDKIRVRHLLVKHSKSRNPSSWKQVPSSPQP